MKDKSCKVCGGKDISIRCREYSIGLRLKHRCRSCGYKWNKKVDGEK